MRLLCVAVLAFSFSTHLPGEILLTLFTDIKSARTSTTAGWLVEYGSTYVPMVFWFGALLLSACVWRTLRTDARKGDDADGGARALVHKLGDDDGDGGDDAAGGGRSSVHGSDSSDSSAATTLRGAVRTLHFWCLSLTLAVISGVTATVGANMHAMAGAYTERAQAHFDHWHWVRGQQPGPYYFGAILGALSAGGLHDALPRGGVAQGAGGGLALALALAGGVALALGSYGAWLSHFTNGQMMRWFGFVGGCGAARGAALAVAPCLVADAYGDKHFGAISGVLAAAAAAGATLLNYGLLGSNAAPTVDEFRRAFVVEAVLALLCVPLVWRLGVEHAARVRVLDDDEGRAMLAAPLLPSARNGRKLVFY